MDTKQVTPNGERPHDQHCAWCDCEEFIAIRYGSLHHLNERTIAAIRKVEDEPACAPGCVDCADEK